MKLFIACSAQNNIPNKYLEDCKVLLKELLKENDLVFGASNSGIMGLAYEIAQENNRNVIGVCTELYKEDLTKLNCHNDVITKSISERTSTLISSCDAILFLPGGIGTINELFVAIDSKRCKEFNKPIIIYNSNGYYNKLLDFINQIYNEGFINAHDKSTYIISDSIEDTLNHINSFK